MTMSKLNNVYIFNKQTYFSGQGIVASVTMAANATSKYTQLKSQLCDGTHFLYRLSSAISSDPCIYVGYGKIEDVSSNLADPLKSGYIFRISEDSRACAVRMRGKKTRKVGYLIEMRKKIHFIYDENLRSELGLDERNFAGFLMKPPAYAA